MLGVQHDLRFFVLVLAAAEFEMVWGKGVAVYAPNPRPAWLYCLHSACCFLIKWRFLSVSCQGRACFLLEEHLAGCLPHTNIRHFLIGLIFYIFIIFDFGASKENPNYWSIMMTFTACQLLYPYAYFVYGRIADYISGDRGSYFVSHIMSVVRIFAVILCWFGAPIIAPLGLAWLYWEHDRQEQ